ncbi:tetratricopeptide repeat protein [Pseudomonas sp. Irchel s3b6]|uniref:tetratricopeptide repeat protein n=1 Tax=Pseudomonas sp. Irchel s3b6 TaxID=2009078 RepID=UPI002115009C|nr:tetratricopeptide repeat protein [Pseudomonas sp. Irchel s3b6]
MSEDIRLLNPWVLAVVAGAVGGLLLLVFQREAVFHPDSRQPDAVSANYAALLLMARPDNDRLRLQLVDLLIQLGDTVKARRYLESWPRPVPALLDYYRLELDSLAVAGAHETLEQRARLEAIDRQSLPLAQLQRLARLALRLQAPAIAAQVHEELASRDPQQRRASLDAAAQWYLAGEQPERAADIYVQLWQGSEHPGDRRQYARQAFDSLLASGRGEQAIEVLADELDALEGPPIDAAWLEQGADIALANTRTALAMQFLERWRTVQPDNPERLGKDFRLRLALGDVPGARESGRQLLIEHPHDVYVLEQLGLLAQWRGELDESLDYWTRLLDLGENPEIRERAWRLAMHLFDFDRAIPLLAVIMDQRALTDDELEALVYSHDSRGTPEQSEAWLRAYLRQYPGHRLAWSKWLLNLDSTGQLTAKAMAYENLSTHFELTLPERLDRSRTYLKLFDNQAAWQVLQVDSRTLVDKGFWHARAALAWDLELDDALQEALEHLLSLEGSLSRADEDRLAALYHARDPQRALSLLVAGWQRSHEPQPLIRALQQARELQDWPQINALLNDAERYPALYDLPQVLAMRGALAVEQGRFDEAAQVYLAGLARYPDDKRFREHLMWLYVDQGNVAALGPLVSKWRVLARQEPTLWLAFASASQLLGRNREALAWYRLHLKAHPQDWLVQAAYADALDSAGYQDAAQRLRLKLIRDLDSETLQPSSERYTTWLRLVATSYSPRKAQQQVLQWQDGSPAMLQLWFERLLARLDASNQPAQKDQWLAWARGQGLQVERYEQIQEALRSRNTAQVEALLGNDDLNPAQRAQALSRLGRHSEALGVSLSELGDEQPRAIREQLRRQAVEGHERTPQGAQLAWHGQDFGGLEFNGPRLRVAQSLGDQWHANLELEQGTYDSDQLISSRLGEERNAELTLQRQVERGHYTLVLDTSQRQDDDRNGFGLGRHWQLGAGDELEAGFDWHRESEDSGLMRTFGQYDGVRLGGRHGFTARDQLSWEVAQKSFSTRGGDALGNGQDVKAEYGHTLQFEGPAWTLRSGVAYQHNQVDDRTLDSLSSNNGGPVRVELPDPDSPLDQPTVVASDLLQSRYGLLYVGSTWRRGMPGALSRAHPQYTWLVDVTVGWQWLDQTVNYGINTGMGMEVLGNDELAFTAGYQSEPQGGNGQAGGTLGVSYSVRLGR